MTTESGAKDLGRLLVGSFSAVGVDLHGGRAVGVAQPGGDRGNRNAGVEKLGGLPVAQVVQPDIRRASVPAGPLPSGRYRVAPPCPGAVGVEAEDVAGATGLIIDTSERAS